MLLLPVLSWGHDQKSGALAHSGSADRWAAQVEDDLNAQLQRLRAEAAAREADLAADVEAQRQLVRQEKEHWEGRFKQADATWCVAGPTLPHPACRSWRAASECMASITAGGFRQQGRGGGGVTSPVAA